MMKHSISILKENLHWLIIILAIEIFSVVLLWLSDIKALRALILLFMIFAIFTFCGISFFLIQRQKKIELAFLEFLSNPNETNEKKLIDMYGQSKRKLVLELSQILTQKEHELKTINTQLKDYEDYVELWAHEIKMPLSLLTLILDNNENNLSPELDHKLDYIRNQIQEYISQILFYYRVKSENKDYLFEDINIKECIEDLLEHNAPLMNEKNVEVHLNIKYETIFSDRRAIEFIIGHLLNNSIKYCDEHPRLEIEFIKKEEQKSLIISDNGKGVKACDLPYIFEKGFTGYLGETRKKSTGMGLYLVKQIANDINIDIDVESEWQKGFKIILTF